MSESPKITRQEALTTASGNIWLVVAGIISAICLVFLWGMREMPPTGAAFTGLVLTVVFYLAMVAVRFGVTHNRLRLWTLAVLTIAIAITFAVVGWIVVVSAGPGV